MEPQSVAIITEVDQDAIRPPSVWAGHWIADDDRAGGKLQGHKYAMQCNAVQCNVMQCAFLSCCSIMMDLRSIL